MLGDYDSRAIEQESSAPKAPVPSVVSVPAIDFDSITESANTIILCTTHQRKIIDDILITSKLDSGLVQVEPIDFKPMTYLEAAISIYKAEAKSKGIELTIAAEKSCKEHKIEWLRGDPSRVMQIVSFVSHYVTMDIC
jgi:signal transduction histidine kinase